LLSNFSFFKIKRIIKMNSIEELERLKEIERRYFEDLKQKGKENVRNKR